MMMDMMLDDAPQPPPPVLLFINSTIHISESSNMAKRNVYHPLRSIGIYSISSAAICHLWRWAVERRSSVGHPASLFVARRATTLRDVGVTSRRPATATAKSKYS